MSEPFTATETMAATPSPHPPSEHGPSVTAAVVAATLLLLRDDVEIGHLVDPKALGPLELAVREVVPLLGVLLDRVPRSVLKRAGYGAERLLSPGFIAHYALRKSAIRDELFRAVHEGYDQVVLVGAGFDMLCVSLPDHVRVFEVDLPATQTAKRCALRGVRSREVTFVPLDLRTDDLREALLATPGFADDADTVFVAEGVLMYLPPACVAAVLRGMRGSGSQRARAVVTVITPDRDGLFRLHTQRRAVDLCMRWLGEPFVWGASLRELEQLLDRCGLRVRRVSSTIELRDNLRTAARRRLPRATGEVIVVADRTRDRVAADTRDESASRCIVGRNDSHVSIGDSADGQRSP